MNLLRKAVKYTYKNKRFELLVISNPVEIDNEFEQANGLFEAGLECFHLRKPDFSKEEYLDALMQIKPSYLRRVMLHDHYELAVKYNIGGFHLTRKSLEQAPAVLKELFKVAKAKGLKLSSSLHSVQGLDQAPTAFDYLLLSPVFDSISKPGYKASINLDDISPILQDRNFKTRIMALGGINIDNLEIVNQAGFDGGAVLGAVWKSADPLEKYFELKNKIMS